MQVMHLWGEQREMLLQVFVKGVRVAGSTGLVGYSHWICIVVRGVSASLRAAVSRVWQHTTISLCAATTFAVWTGTLV